MRGAWALLVVASACGGAGDADTAPPTTPVTEPPAPSSAAPAEPSPAATLQADDDGARLTLPQGALPPGIDPAAVALVRVETDDDATIVYSLEPDGLELLAPARLAFDVAAFTPGDFVLVAHVSAGGVELLSADVTPEEGVAVDIGHFSTIAVAFEAVVEPRASLLVDHGPIDEIAVGDEFTVTAVPQIPTELAVRISPNEVLHLLRIEDLTMGYETAFRHNQRILEYRGDGEVHGMGIGPAGDKLLDWLFGGNDDAVVSNSGLSAPFACLTAAATSVGVSTKATLDYDYEVRDAAGDLISSGDNLTGTVFVTGFTDLTCIDRIDADGPSKTSEPPPATAAPGSGTTWTIEVDPADGNPVTCTGTFTVDGTQATVTITCGRQMDGLALAGRCDRGDDSFNVAVENADTVTATGPVSSGCSFEWRAGVFNRAGFDDASTVAGDAVTTNQGITVDVTSFPPIP